MMLPDAKLNHLADEFINREIGETYGITFGNWIKHLDYYRKIENAVEGLKKQLTKEAESYDRFDNFASSRIPVAFSTLSRYIRTSRTKVEKLVKEVWLQSRTNKAVKEACDRIA